MQVPELCLGIEARNDEMGCSIEIDTLGMEDLVTFFYRECDFWKH